MQKAFLPVAVSDPRDKQGYPCGGHLSNVTISDIPEELVMGRAYRNPLGQKCNFVQKKNGMVYLRKLGRGGDLRTQRTMGTSV